MKKQRAFFLITILSSIVIAATPPANAPTPALIDSAVLKKITVSGSAFSGSLEILLNFNSGQDSSAISNTTRYKIFPTDQPLNVFIPKRISTSKSTEVQHQYKTANIEDTLLDGDKDYQLQYTDETGKVNTVNVIKDPSAIDTGASIIRVARWISKSTSIDLDVRQIVKTNNAIAADYNLDLEIFQLGSIATNTSTSNISFISSGKLGTDSTKTPNTLSADIAFTWLNHLAISPEELLFCGIRIPAGFEGPQTFQKDSMQYDVKIQAACSIPYISDIFLWWHRAIKYDEIFLPPLIYFGYTNAWKSDNTSHGRIDGEFIFKVPLGPQIGLGLSGTASYVDNDWKTSYNVSTNLTATKAISLILKYSKGELAPFFNKFENLGLGFLMQL
jgi:hypothetical protein